ncbi:hypothetical protein CF088_13955 [Clostridium botulinum]|uniref:hypothetical protein n=1 Tax=Clostridium botulinum TaxID=1491 RepID=UPI000774B298|nr:hypothetical protein [Clostridium botulinum]MBN3406366.1 hypothetical protein [Clostridium botulinum]NEZ84386.1 hypothetical protein [Clostridium botulinum]NFA07505.1 hypothetical protein [Clostridium botulinum]NFA26030.1 hypothetical protein [Clostridium botulinum]NFB80865.1 hypothetical protein [Clostridium botulinum]
MNKEQIIKEKIVSLFRKHNIEGSITQLFVCRYFDTKDIEDLRVLERAKLNPQLKIELTNLLRSYFNLTNKMTAYEQLVKQIEESFKYSNADADEYAKKLKDMALEEYRRDFEKCLG